MITHYRYPPQLTALLNMAGDCEALIIERRGLIQVNACGCVIFIAYRSIGIWLVEFPIAGERIVFPVGGELV